MRHLILVRHSLPEIVPTVPGRYWQLSAEGRARCQVVAEQLSAYQPSAIVSSMEPKAAETANLLSAHLHLSYRIGEGLHEHMRDTVPYLGQAEWEQTISAFFARPDELVFGSETATQALQRFTLAVQQVLQQQNEGDVVIVTHGTVMALFVALHTLIPALPFWHSLSMPTFVVLSVPAFSLVKTVVRVDIPSQ